MQEKLFSVEDDEEYVETIKNLDSKYGQLALYGLILRKRNFDYKNRIA